MVLDLVLLDRHLDFDDVEALALRRDARAEAEEHAALCARCRAEVDDLARFAQTVDAPPPPPPRTSRVAELLAMEEEGRREAVASRRWSLEELQELSEIVVAAEKDGPERCDVLSRLLASMCDHAEDAPLAIVTALKLQALYRRAVALAQCGDGAEAEAVLLKAEDLAGALPNSEHYTMRIDLARASVHVKAGGRSACAAGSVQLEGTSALALSFGDARLYFLTEHYRGCYYYGMGRYDRAAEAFVNGAGSPEPWHRQSALYAASSAFLRGGDVDRSEEYLRRTEEVQIDPPYALMLPRIPWQRGLIAMARGRYAEACRMLRKAIDLMAPFTEHEVLFICIDLAEAHVLAGEYSEAIEAARHAISHLAKLPPSFSLGRAISILEEAFASREVTRIRASLEEARGVAREAAQQAAS